MTIDIAYTGHCIGDKITGKGYLHSVAAFAESNKS